MQEARLEEGVGALAGSEPVQSDGLEPTLDPKTLFGGVAEEVAQAPAQVVARAVALVVDRQAEEPLLVAVRVADRRAEEALLVLVQEAGVVLPVVEPVARPEH
eukprot:GHVU01003748.1.p3 GENE.GHVU01003748.1~~GHVU01003748.1.p3  ORF type:complete len:103 (+),score=19.23 GHVU01003748.1:287-595(+)